jgi:signal transduction histidine kinase
LLFCAVLAALVAWLRLGIYGHAAVGIGYSLPIVLVAWTRRRSLVWGMCAIFVAMASFKFWMNFYASPLPLHHEIAGLAMLMGDLLIVAAIVDMVLRRGLALDRGRQELYRKGQELRISNQGLLERQEMTDALLKLSRSLDAGLNHEAFTAIADTVHRLLGDSIAVALWELRGEEVAALGHDGFGPGGPEVSGAHHRSGFARLVIQSQKSAAVVNAALRPELPPVRNGKGETLQAMLGAPLKLSGEVVGALVVYGTQSRFWTEADISLVESLAAQASVSITAASLLGRIEKERKEAEDASLSKSRFLAAVSHDIRTPANAISLLAELIRRSAQDPAQTGEIPEIAHELERCSASLVNFVSDVLDLTRLDLGRFELHESDFEFNQCLSDAFHQLQPLAGEKNLEFVCNPFPTAVRLHADRIKLSRVLTNLMGNAIKYTERGRVCVSAERLPDGCIRVSVSDTGIGIAPENLSAIFDEFAQLKNPDRAKSTGPGLGLSISKRLVGIMGGRLEVVSQIGKGSTFSFTLPASCVIE